MRLTILYLLTRMFLVILNFEFNNFHFKYLFSFVELLVDGLGRSSPIDDAEACIYGYGAIRFLASANTNTIINKKTKDKDSKTITISKQKSLAYRLARHGIIQLMILHLQLLNEFGSNSKLCGPPLHALFQLSGALRTLSGAPIFAQIISARSRLLADHGRNQVKVTF